MPNQAPGQVTEYRYTAHYYYRWDKNRKYGLMQYVWLRTAQVPTDDLHDEALYHVAQHTNFNRDDHLIELVTCEELVVTPRPDLGWKNPTKAPIQTR